MGDDRKQGGRSELRHALHELTQRAGVQRVNLLEALQGDLSALRQCWSVNLSNGLKVAQNTVAVNLHAHIEKLAPRPARQELSLGGRRQQYQNAIRVCFNIRNYPELEGSDLTQRQAWLADKARGSLKIAKKTCSRDLEHALDQIEQQILAMERERLDAREQSQAIVATPAAALSPARRETAFIPRPSLDEQFRTLWSTALTDSRWDRPDVLCLVGEIGTGKSRYMRELLAASAAVWIKADSPDMLSVSLAEALTPYGISVETLDIPGLKREFGKVLARTDGPTLIVIDGVREPTEIDAWVPRPAQARMIITSRRWPAKDYWSPVLQVGEMTPDEATAMVRSLLPSADTDQAASLAASLGYRPVAIEQACAFLGDSPTPEITGLVGLLASRTATAIESLPDRTNAGLTLTCRNITATLREEHPDSHELLRLLAFVPPLYIPHQLVMGFLARHLPIEEHERFSCERAYEAAVRPLRKLCLLEESDLGIRLNALTKEVLRDLLWEDLLEILDRYSAATDSVSAFDMGQFGWSPAEMASFGVIEALCSPRILEVVATKAQPDEADRYVTRAGKVLTADEWNAVSEALWERQYRVATIHQLMQLGDGMSGEELAEWLRPHTELLEQLAGRIPDQDSWWDRVHAFDFHEFLAWVASNDQIDRQQFLTSVGDGTLDEFMQQVRIYQIARAIWMLGEDPVVETRLGRIDLRELSSRRDEPHNTPPYTLSHPPVALALEGEGDMCHAQLALQALGYADASELLRLIKFDKNYSYLTVLTGMTTVPIIGEQVPGTRSWRLRKPFTPLYIAASPEGPFATSQGTEGFRNEQLSYINALLQARGVTHPNPDELHELVNIHVWHASCYEFEHFTDEELADGITAAHPTTDGWRRDELIAALGYWREQRQDIEATWTIGRWDEHTQQMTGPWTPEVSKTALALFGLWPTLERKIEQLKAGIEIPVPPIVQIVDDACRQAQRRREIPFILTEVPDQPDAAQAR